MPRFLANWEVETDIILPDDTPYLRYDHPGGRYTAFLRNIAEDRGGIFFLSMQFIFEAPALTEARDVGEPLAKEFLDYLTLASNLKARLRNILQIFNWEPDSPAMRDCLYFSPSAAHGGGPFEALQKPLLDSVAMLQSHTVDPRLRRALKWFANGVAAHAPDDQFSFFWFVIELVAQHIRNPAPVPDKCPVCRGGALLRSMRFDATSSAVSQTGSATAFCSLCAGSQGPGGILQKSKRHAKYAYARR